MHNIEFKARCPDPDVIRAVLAKAGIPLDRRMRQVDTYFNAPDGRLKLREIDFERAELIFYQRMDRAAARQSNYVRVEVDDPAAKKAALACKLGVRCVVDKIRELYLWEHTRVHLDMVAGLGTFMELETVVTDQCLDDASAECERIRTALGVKSQDLLEQSYADMV